MQTRQEPTASQRADGPRGLRTLTSDFSAVLGGRVASVALSLGTVAVTTHLLGPTGYGQLAYLTVVATLIFVTGSAWTSAGVLRYGREAYDATGLMQAVTWERVAITAPALLGAAAIALLLRALGWMPGGLTWALVALAVTYGLVLTVSDHVVYVLQAVGRMQSSAWATVLRQIAVLALIGVLITAGVDFSAGEIAGVMIVGWLLMTAAAAVPVWRTALWPPRWNAVLRRRMLRFALPLLAFTVSQYVIATVDLLVLGIYTSATQVGVYAVAYQGYTALQNVGTASATVLTPLFVSLQTAGRSTAIAHFAKRVIPQVTFLAGTGLGVVAPFTTLLVVGVFGNAFRDAAQPLVILLIPATLLVMANLQAPVILLYEDTRDVGRINVVAAAINVILDFLLIGPAGLRGTGAAIATTLATLAIVIGYTGIVTRRAGSASPARLLLLLAPLLLGTLCGVRTTEWLSAVFAAGGVLVVALALVVCGLVFDRGDEEYLRRLGLPAPLRRMLLGSVLVSR